MINVADLVNPETGNTYREDNAKLVHKIPLGALVEIKKTDSRDDYGQRLFVVEHSRDCDQEPLYTLSHLPLKAYQRNKLNEEDALSMVDGHDEFTRVDRAVYQMYKWSNNGSCTGGYGEESLEVIRLPEAQ